MSIYRRSQQALVRAEDNSIIDPFYFRTKAYFGTELLGRYEIIEQGAQRPVDSSQSVLLGGSGEAVIADEVSHTGVIVLLNKTGIVLVVGAGTGELDTLGSTPGDESGVDEFGVVIAIQAHKGKRE